MNQIAKEIFFRTKKNVYSNKYGDNISLSIGEGLNFKEIRDYNSSDDIKYINWKATARTQDLKVNVFNEDKELNILITIFVSGSINFGSIRFKQDIVAEIVSILAMSSIKNSNSVEILLYSEEVIKIFPVTKKENQILNIIDFITKYDFKYKKINYKKYAEFINQRKRKYIIFQIGDFHDEINLEGISYKNEIYNFVVRDSIEENINISDDYNFIDAMLGVPRPRINKKRLKKRIKSNDEKNKEYYTNNGIHFGKVYTNDDVYKTMNDIFRTKQWKR